MLNPFRDKNACLPRHVRAAMGWGEKGLLILLVLICDPGPYDYSSIRRAKMLKISENAYGCGLGCFFLNSGRRKRAST